MCDILVGSDLNYLVLSLILILSIIYYVAGLHFNSDGSQKKRFDKILSELEELQALDVEHKTKIE